MKFSKSFSVNYNLFFKPGEGKLIIIYADPYAWRALYFPGFQYIAEGLLPAESRPFQVNSKKTK